MPTNSDGGIRKRVLWRRAKGELALIVEIDAGSAHMPQSKDGCGLFLFFPDG